MREHIWLVICEDIIAGTCTYVVQYRKASGKLTSNWQEAMIFCLDKAEQIAAYFGGRVQEYVLRPEG